MGIRLYGKVTVTVRMELSKYKMKFVRAQGSDWTYTPPVDKEFGRDVTFTHPGSVDHDFEEVMGRCDNIGVGDDDIYDWLYFSIPGYPSNSIWAVYFRARRTFTGFGFQGTEVKAGWVENWEDRSTDSPIAQEFQADRVNVDHSTKQIPNPDSIIPDDQMEELDINITFKSPNEANWSDPAPWGRHLSFEDIMRMMQDAARFPFQGTAGSGQ